MKIKFKNLNMFYNVTVIMASICILVQISEPDIGKYSKTAQYISLAAIVIFGVLGFLLAVFEKSKIIDIIYTAEDKKTIFYKIIKFTENMSSK